MQDTECSLYHLADPISYDEILNYARKLSQTTTAPPGFKLQLDEEEGGGEVQAEEAGQTKTSLYQGNGEINQGKAGQVPPHLQDKLPFPSVQTMRRSAMEVPLLTWDAYIGGFQTTGKEEEQQTDTAPESRKQKPSMTNTTRHKAPAEDDDDGFGLDLN